MDHWVLGGPDGKTPIKTDVKNWAKEFDKNRRVATTSIAGIRISTVFLGLDHAFNTSGPPLLFETMIFDKPGEWTECYCTRCSTWDQAEKQHEKAVQMVKRYNHEGLKKPSELWRVFVSKGFIEE